MPASDLLRLAMVIERGADPIKGSLQREGGAPSRFDGWIELAAVLDALIVAAPPRDGGAATDRGPA